MSDSSVKIILAFEKTDLLTIVRYTDFVYRNDNKIGIGKT